MDVLSKISDLIFTRRYLSPKAAFVYTAESSTTQTFLNVAPQWKVIDKSDWNLIERLVIRRAESFGRDLVVFDGTLGHLKLTDYGEPVGKHYIERIIYLYPSLKLFRVPLYFWKLVYEPTSNKGDVFVLVNNPHISKPEDYHICSRPKPRFTGKVALMFAKYCKISSGYTYTCAIDDFATYNDLSLDGLSVDTVSESLFGYDYKDNIHNQISSTTSAHDPGNNPSTSGSHRLIHDELR